jgi:multisubunit Na+/H+ antiporter MnhB subunit
MEIEPEESRTKITGMSALYALGIALIGVTFLSIVYGLMAMAVRYHETGQLNVGILDFFGFFPVVGVCAGPIIFLLGFALLQRIRLPW